MNYFPYKGGSAGVFGLGMTETEFVVDFDRGKSQIPDAYYRIENNFPSPRNRIMKFQVPTLRTKNLVYHKFSQHFD